MIKDAEQWDTLRAFFKDEQLVADIDSGLVTTETVICRIMQRIMELDKWQADLVKYNQLLQTLPPRNLCS